MKAPSWKDGLLSLVMVIPIAILMTSYMKFQDSVLPLSEKLQSGFQEIFGGESLHPALLFLLFALSPAICEEALWRGTFQGEVQKERRPLKTILLVGLFFGLFHLSIYRFVPTALLGGVLAFLRWRTGSIFPSVMFHASYNTLVLFGVTRLADSQNQIEEYLYHPCTVVMMCGIVFLAMRNVGRRSRNLKNLKII